MTLPRRPQAVVFDMDGLLFDTEVLYRQACIDASTEIGLDYPDSLYLATIGLTANESTDIVRAHFGPDLDIPALWDRTRELFRQLADTQLRMKAGVVELLDRLDQLGLPRAIATSSRRESVEHHLRHHRLEGRFHAVVAYGDYERSKPAPDPYLLAAERLRIAPEQCLALEDSHNGIRAAASAGMMTIMVPDLLEPTEEIRAMCVRVSRTLHDVRELLGD